MRRRRPEDEGTGRKPQSQEVERLSRAWRSSWPPRSAVRWSFLASSSGSEIKKVFLSGGCAKIQMLPGLIKERIGIPVEVFNPFAKIDYSPESFDPEYIKQMAPLAPSAWGWPCGERF